MRAKSAQQPRQYRGAWLAGLWLLGFCLAASGAEAEPSRQGLFRVSYDSELEPIRINRMHAWILQIDDAAGQPVEGAAISVSGGMPAHDHGLATSPRVTEELGGGRYRLEGLRFHMAGRWELQLEIRAGELRDRVVLPLEL